MVDPGWLHEESPFHSGEIAIQERLGVRAKIEKVGRRLIRDYLPEQHRQFYTQLPFLIAGTVDASDRLWASILVGLPGFLSTLDKYTLHVASKPLFGDPLGETLAASIDIGLLGIEFHTRRRNRLNGTVVATAEDGFTIKVGQSFGNCPQYIQARMFQLIDAKDVATPKPPYQIEALGEPERAIIAAADTFFIATAFYGDKASNVQGVDVSHRGGKPGFVRIDSDRILTIPDFSGNFHFNTLGNLMLNPSAGLLFIDFDRGDLLYLTGTAEIIWDDEVRAFAGAERLLRFHLSNGRRVVGSLPLRWSVPEYSPLLAHTS